MTRQETSYTNAYQTLLLHVATCAGTWSANTEVKDGTIIITEGDRKEVVTYSSSDNVTDVSIPGRLFLRRAFIYHPLHPPQPHTLAAICLLQSTLPTGCSPSQLPISAANVDMVLECTGVFLTRATLQPYFDKGIKKVVVSAPVKDPEPVLNIVMGCNDHLYDAAKDHIVTAASCTTNCLAPVVKVGGREQPPCQPPRLPAWADMGCPVPCVHACVHVPCSRAGAVGLQATAATLAVSAAVEAFWLTPPCAALPCPAHSQAALACPRCPGDP